MRGDLEGLANFMRREIHNAMAQYKRTRIGVVDQWDPEKHVVKVKYQPGDQLSGWLPVGTQFMGKEFGYAHGLSKGDQVQVSFQEGSLQTGMVTHRLWSDEDKPVKDVKSGENHLVGKHFQAVKMYSDKDRDDELKKALLIRGHPGENKKDEDGDAASVLFDKDGNLIRKVRKGNSSETVDKGDRTYEIKEGKYTVDIQKGKGNVKHPQDDFVFEPGSGKKVEVKGSGTSKRVMLEDGSFSNVLKATNS